jgi:hypothetical protein
MKKIVSIVLFLTCLIQNGFSQSPALEEIKSEELNTITDSLNFVIEVSYTGQDYGPGFKAEIKTEGGRFFCYYSKNDPKAKKIKIHKKEVKEAFLKELKERINYRIQTDPDNCTTKTSVKISNLTKFFTFSFSDCLDVSFDDDFFKLK